MIGPIHEFLHERHPFVLLDETDLARITATVENRTFAAGATILRRGGPISPGLYLIASGSVRLDRDSLAGQHLEEGDYFGYPSIIGGEPPSATVIAETPLTVYCIPANVFRDLLGNAGFAEFFLKSLGERLRQVSPGGQASLGGELTTPVGDLGLRPVIRVKPDETVAEAARAMGVADDDVAIVDSLPPGIITDHDFQVKVLARDLGPATTVRDVMTPSLKTVDAATPVHGALLFMLEEHIHHLPVTRDGELIGVVSATDLLRHQTRNPLYLTRQLEHVADPAALKDYHLNAAAMVDRLFNGGLKVAQIGRIFASVNDTLMRRLLRLAEEQLGPAPCPYTWLVFGSEGRMEQALITDQDNALVYADDSPANADYFARLATVIVDHLLVAGFPPCPGGYMATNWCKPLAAWLDLMSRWVQTPTPESLMMVGIFFDFRAAAGNLSVEPMERIIAEAADQSVFMAHMARQGLGFKPPLNIFHRIQADEGMVDLKTGGIAPIVAAGRAYGILAGTRLRPTRNRFEAAMSADLIDRDTGEVVIETYRYLLQLRLREQLAVLKAGGKPDNRIRLKGLSSLEQRHLKDAFGVIRGLQDKVARRFRVELLG